MKKNAIIFGAGNIGRGFMGQLFSESGYHVTFVDVDLPLLDAFNERGEYTIKLVTNQRTDEVTVGPVAGVPADNGSAVAEVIVKAEIGATAVGARALKYVAPNVAMGIARRARQGVEAPLNLILCENLKGAADAFRGMVKAELPPAHHAYMEAHIGFVDTVIARMIPPLPADLHAKDPSFIIVEPYKRLPVDADAFVGDPPPVVGMIPASPFSFYTEQKLYMHNATHAVLGYLGYQYGYTLGYEALADAHIWAAAAGTMAESQQALEKKYSLPGGELTPFVDDLLERFGNRALGDTVFRLARDPIRKLAHSDRLVGAALNALEQGVEPINLVAGIVAAFKFDHPDDPIAAQLQAQLRQDGLESMLQNVCGLSPDSHLARRVVAGVGSIKT